MNNVLLIVTLSNLMCTSGVVDFFGAKVLKKAITTVLCCVKSLLHWRLYKFTTK